MRVIARFPLARQSVPYVSLDRVVYTWVGREDTGEPFNTGFRDRDSRQWTLAKHAQGYAHGTRTRMSFAMSRSRNAYVLNARIHARCCSPQPLPSDTLTKPRVRVTGQLFVQGVWANVAREGGRGKSIRRCVYRRKFLSNISV